MAAETGSHVLEKISQDPARRERVSLGNEVFFPPFERAQLYLNIGVYNGNSVMHGHGEPVMVIPGLLGSDIMYYEMHAWLIRIGYHPITAGITNVGKISENIGRVESKLEQTRRETGQKTIMIGHSLGGDIGLVILKERPDLTDTLFTLGTPFDLGSENSIDKSVRELGRRLITDSDHVREILEAEKNNPLPEGSSLHILAGSLDGVVGVEATHEPEASSWENILASHLGFMANPWVNSRLASDLNQVSLNRRRAQAA